MDTDFKPTVRTDPEVDAVRRAVGQSRLKKSHEDLTTKTLSSDSACCVSWSLQVRTGESSQHCVSLVSIRCCLFSLNIRALSLRLVTLFSVRSSKER